MWFDWLLHAHGVVKIPDAEAEELVKLPNDSSSLRYLIYSLLIRNRLEETLLFGNLFPLGNRFDQHNVKSDM